VMDYANGEWQTPEIMPFGDMSFNPAFLSIHYGQSIFEGMKAHRAENSDDVLLFRPEENALRLQRSAERMAIPPVPVDVFMNSLRSLVDLDRNWVPDTPESALYLRPFVFATDQFIGVRPSDSYRFVIFTCPVGPYYPAPVSVMVAEEFVRAFPGGTGDAKAAGNYAATLHPAKLAKKAGYDQILWTDGFEHKYFEEIGTMNVFFVVDGKVLTPELSGTILPGITRQSIIELLKEQGVTVEERKVSVDEIVAAQKAGLLQDMFGAGTAATVTHIAMFGYQGTNYDLPPISERKLSLGLKQSLEDIKRGRAGDTRNWIVRV
ncbi:MAG: branched-chain amino acid aminotransferase, partial [Chitinophagales bacterium]